MDYYNSEKPHRGVRREWTWGAPPPQAAPTDALRAAHSNGWHPVYLSEEAVDLIFLPQATRVVDRGRINFRNSRYEHDGLIELDKKSVDLRFDPMDPGWILAFHQGRFICRAEPVEYSSMKDKDLASRKIAEKQRLRAEYTRRYRELTSQIPDFRTYSQVPAAEKAAALVNTAKRKQIGEQNALVRRRTPEELEAEVKKLEAGGERLEARPAAKGMAGRPAYFLTDLDRYKWIVKHELRQEELLEEDQVFKAAYEGRMGEAERERWAVVKELGNQQ